MLPIPSDSNVDRHEGEFLRVLNSLLQDPLHQDVKPFGNGYAHGELAGAGARRGGPWPWLLWLLLLILLILLLLVLWRYCCSRISKDSDPEDPKEVKAPPPTLPPASKASAAPAAAAVPPPPPRDAVPPLPSTPPRGPSKGSPQRGPSNASGEPPPPQQRRLPPPVIASPPPPAASASAQDPRRSEVPEAVETFPLAPTAERFRIDTQVDSDDNSPHTPPRERSSTGDITQEVDEVRAKRNSEINRKFMASGSSVRAKASEFDSLTKDKDKSDTPSPPK